MVASSHVSAIASVSILLAFVAASTDWYVDVNATGCATGTGTAADPFCSITDAIHAASGGDTIHIAPGTYLENLVVDEDVTLIGTEGELQTIVDGGSALSVLDLLASNAVVVRGLTLTNGFALNGGGGVQVGTNATLLLTDSTVSGNSTSGGNLGGGGVSNFGNATLVNTTVADNYAAGRFGYFGYGGGIMNNGSMTVVNSVIRGNRVGGYVLTLGSAVANLGQIDLLNCTIVENSGATAVAQAGFSRGPLRVRDSIVWDNNPFGPQVRVESQTTVDFSNVERGWTGNGSGNLDLDPLFSDSVGGDYRLLASSRCVDAGDPASALTGLARGGNPRLLDGDLDRTMAVDMGAFEFDNVQLTMTGSATPGATLRVHATGTPGLRAFLLVGRFSGERLRAPWGSFFFAPESPLRVLGLVRLPVSRELATPADFATLAGFTLQVLAVDLMTGAGNASNPLTVE